MQKSVEYQRNGLKGKSITDYLSLMRQAIRLIASRVRSVEASLSSPVAIPQRVYSSRPYLAFEVSQQPYACGEFPLLGSDAQ